MSLTAIERFNEAVRRDPGAARQQWRRLQESFGTRGITFGGAPMATLLRPQFIDRNTWTSLTLGARRLVEVSNRVAQAAFDSNLERLLDFLGAPEAHRRLLRFPPPGPDVALSRVDAFAKEGAVKFIEINSDAPAAFGYADRMASVFSELPLVSEMRDGGSLEAVGSLDALANELRALARVEKPRIAIVDLKTVRTRPDQEIIREEFERRGVCAVLADPRELEIVNNRLVSEGQPVDLVYRRTVISEVLDVEAEARGFFEAYERGLAVFVNSFRCYLSEDKAFFAILTDERYESLLTADERRFVASHVPWTRKVEARETTFGGRTIDLIPWIDANRTRLVLKPSHGYGGASVTVGSAVDDRRWSEAIQAASSGSGWIVQERVEIPEEEFPVFDAQENLTFETLKVNTNPFYVNGHDVGAVTRVSRDAVINVSAGGGSVPTFIV